MTYKLGYVDIDRANVLGVEHVFVDGNEVPYAVAFNDEEGWVDVYATDPNGSMIRDANGELHVKRVFGKITAAGK